MDWLVRPAIEPLKGRCDVPPDKSISHRILLFAALSENQQVSVFLPFGEDVGRTQAALRQLGVSISDDLGGDTAHLIRMVKVSGVGLHGLSEPKEPLYLGNSGTSMRLLAGLLCGLNIEATLTGDDSLMQRPMMRIVEPLRQMGARIECAADGTPPLRILPAGKLKGITYRLPVASAQVKSAILLAGLYAEGTTEVIESRKAPSRNHTEKMLAALAKNSFEIEEKGEDRIIRIRQSDSRVFPEFRALQATGDISSAAFPLVAAAVCPHARVSVSEVGINETRTGLLHYLDKMGASVEKRGKSLLIVEPLASLTVRGPEQLTGCRVGTSDEGLASVIDEIPALAMAMACANGASEVRGAGELRHKESDRIASVCRGLEAVGVEVEEYEDRFRIQGIGSGNQLPTSEGAEVDSVGDHRIAMAFASLAPRLHTPIRILNCDAVATSFPTFVQQMERIGIHIEVEQTHA